MAETVEDVLAEIRADGVDAWDSPADGHFAMKCAARIEAALARERVMRSSMGTVNVDVPAIRRVAEEIARSECDCTLGGDPMIRPRETKIIGQPDRQLYAWAAALRKAIGG